MKFKFFKELYTSNIIIKNNETKSTKKKTVNYYVF